MLNEILEHTYTHPTLSRLFAKTNIKATNTEVTFDATLKFCSTLIGNIHRQNLNAQEDYNIINLANYLVNNPDFYKVLLQIQSLAEYHFLAIAGVSQLCRARDILKFYVINVNDPAVYSVFEDAYQSMFIKNYVCACGFPW